MFAQLKLKIPSNGAPSSHSQRVKSVRMCANTCWSKFKRISLLCMWDTLSSSRQCPVAFRDFSIESSCANFDLFHSHSLPLLLSLGYSSILCKCVQHFLYSRRLNCHPCFGNLSSRGYHNASAVLITCLSAIHSRSVLLSSALLACTQGWI